MTGFGQLVDPQLEAFWASDPSVLRPVETPDTTTRQRSRTRIAIELGAAFYTVAMLVRHELAKHPNIDPLHPHTIATQVFDMYRDVFAELATPAVTTAFTDGGVEGLSADELAQLSSDYVTNLGDYVSTTSADALVAGVNQQLNEKWDALVAFHRASAAYGLDRRGMLGFVAAVMSTSVAHPGELISTMAHTIADRGLAARAELLGDAESHTATETGKALSWLYLQRRGGLPDTAMREWDTSHLEDTCGICVPMDRVQVPLDQPFETPAGKMWGPQAHPNCQCRVKLVVPIAKAEPEPKAQRQRERPQAHTAQAEPEKPWDADLHPRGAHGLFADVAEAPVDAPTVAPRVSGFTVPVHGFTVPVKGFTAPDSYPAPVTGFGTTTGFSAPATGFTAPRGRQNVVITRSVTIPGIALRPPNVIALGAGPSRKTFYASADEFNAATNTALGTIYATGDPLSFNSVLPSDDLGNGVVAEHFNEPWSALDQDLTFRARADGKNIDTLDAAWGNVVSHAHSVWREVVDDPEKYLNRLAPKELQMIAHYAGRFSFLESDEGAFTDAQAHVQGDTDYAIERWPGTGQDSRIRRAIYRSITDDRADDSLGDAFADYVTYQHPLWVGGHGEDLASVLDMVESTYHVDFCDLPVQQVFAFDQGWHPGNHRDGRVVPTDEYIITGRTYRSALGDAGRHNPRMFRIGLSIAHLAAFTRPEGDDAA